MFNSCYSHANCKNVILWSVLYGKFRVRSFILLRQYYAYDNARSHVTNGGISCVPADNRQCVFMVNRTTFHLFSLLVTGVWWPLSPVNRYDCRTYIQSTSWNMLTVHDLLLFYCGLTLSDFTLSFRVASPTIATVSVNRPWSVWIFKPYDRTNDQTYLIKTKPSITV